MCWQEGVITRNRKMDRYLLVLPFIGIIIVFNIGVIHCEDLKERCAKAIGIDCVNGYTAEGDELVCASDNNNYDNLCFFTKAKCSVPDLSIVHFGSCNYNPTVPSTLKTILMTSTTTRTPLDEREILQKVFCSTSQNITCGTEHKPICASDGLLYRNDCEFAKAGCNRTDSLEVLPLQNCPPEIVG